MDSIPEETVDVLVAELIDEMQTFIFNQIDIQKQIKRSQLVEIYDQFVAKNSTLEFPTSRMVISQLHAKLMAEKGIKAMHMYDIIIYIDTKAKSEPIASSSSDKT